MKKNSGITLIALVITIIILLILAGINIATLTSNNRILTQTAKAKNETIISKEKEQIELAYISATIKKSEDNVSSDELQKELIQSIGSNKTLTTSNGDETLTVFFIDTEHFYIVNKGQASKITIIDESDIKEAELSNVNILVSNLTRNSVTVYTDKKINDAQKYVYYYKSSESSNYIYGGESNSYNEQVTISGLNSKNIYKIVVVAMDKNEKIINKSQNIPTIITYEKAEVDQIYDENRTYIDSNGLTANIPSGAKVSNQSTSDISSGLVLNLKGSEFVWIPVSVAIASNKEDAQTTKAMATLDDDGNYTGIFYSFNDDGTSIILNSNNKEPAYLEVDADYLYIINNILGTSYSSITDWENILINDYNEMIKSVNKYGGFYIGRYETSVTDEEIAASVKNAIATKAQGVTINRNDNKDLKWYGLYALQKAYASDVDIKSISSSMIWGSQWDAVLNLALTTDEAYKVYTDVNGNTNISSGSTGINSNDVIMNIYDMQGNYIDITLERTLATFRTSRGNTASGSAPMSSRAGRWPHSSEQGNPLATITSRITLYIN